MSDYEFDVFLSYKRHDLILSWLVEVEKRLSFWLTQELGGKPAKIFFDKESIETGMNWPIRLRDALQKSRCLVGIWSPEYFRSKWCVTEWRTFQERERVLGFNDGRLILPLRFHDGEWFPDDAKAIQCLDVSSCTSTLPAFWDTDRAVELENTIKQFTARVADVVINAPPYDPEWPTKDADPIEPPKITLKRL